MPRIKMSRVLILGLEDLCLHPASAIPKACDLEQVPSSVIFVSHVRWTYSGHFIGLLGIGTCSKWELV